jgi:hypothetical protein
MRNQYEEPRQTTWDGNGDQPEPPSDYEQNFPCDEPEMFSFEWTCRALGLPVPEEIVEQNDWLDRNRDEEAWEREQAEKHAREQSMQPDHD